MIFLWVTFEKQLVMHLPVWLTSALVYVQKDKDLKLDYWVSTEGAEH